MNDLAGFANDDGWRSRGNGRSTGPRGLKGKKRANKMNVRQDKFISYRKREREGGRERERGGGERKRGGEKRRRTELDNCKMRFSIANCKPLKGDFKSNFISTGKCKELSPISS